MADRSYWMSTSSGRIDTPELGNRLSRRRAMAAAGAAAGAAAFLAACGGNGSSKSGSDKSGLVSQPVDTSKQARPGGLNKWYLNSEPAGFDIHVGGNPKNNP